MHQTKSRGPRHTTSGIAAIVLPAVTRKCPRDAEIRVVRKKKQYIFYLGQSVCLL